MLPLDYEPVALKSSANSAVRRAAFILLEVPEGRYNVAHRETVGCTGRLFAAPEGRHRVNLVPPLRGWAL
jgi:hypothetical protein